MTVFELLHLPIRQIIMPVHFLMLSVLMSLFFIFLRDERSLRDRALLLAYLLFDVGLFYLMSASIFREYAYISALDEYPAFLAAFGSLPAFIVAFYEVLTAMMIFGAVSNLIRYRKKHPTPRSIKETLDLLPAGIAFLRADGSAVLHNIVLEDLSQQVSGAPFKSLNSILEGDSAVTGDAFQENITGSISGISGSNGTIHQVSLEKTDIDGEPFTQLVVFDITEQSKITEELTEKNGKLKDIHMRLDIYNKQAERMIIAQELLTARMAVHNELGNVLLESRHYLNDPASFDEEILLRALKNTNTYLLREYEADDSADDPLTDALEMADAIGVEVIFAGITPQTDPYRSILAAAITECSTNTVKHADGNELRVDIKEKDGSVIYILCGNGRQPKGKVVETGGLGSLRALAEKAGGTMDIILSPQLVIAIALPAGFHNNSEKIW